jgi:FkbM family methyltransferase
LFPDFSTELTCLAIKDIVHSRSLIEIELDIRIPSSYAVRRSNHGSYTAAGPVAGFKLHVTENIRMAFAAWKRFETSPRYQRIKTALKQLVGKELRLKLDIPLETIIEGGWCFNIDGINQNSIVYSLGVGEDIEFDLLLIKRFGVQLHAFDPTPSTVEMLSNTKLPDSFHFHPWAITAVDGNLKFYPRVRKDGSKSEVMYTMIADPASKGDAIDVPAFSLDSITSKLSHSHIDLLKMDIEGAEYEVLEGLLKSPIKPRQLLVEFHHRFPGIGPEKTADIIRRLRLEGYRIFAFSENNREVSFLRTD